MLLNPPVNGKIQGLFKPLSVFQVLFKANFIFKDVLRQSCIFKYFSSLCECSENDRSTGHFQSIFSQTLNLNKQFK